MYKRQVKLINIITGIKTMGSNIVGLLKTLEIPLRQTAIAIDKEIPLAALVDVCILTVGSISSAKFGPRHPLSKLTLIIKCLMQ